MGGANYRSIRFLISKISILFVAGAFFCLNMSNCSAANWVWIWASAEYTYELDISSIEKVSYPDVGNNIVCWLRVTHIDKSYTIGHHAYRIKNGNRELAVFEGVAYDSQGDVKKKIKKNRPYEADYMSIIPDSNGEYIFKAILQYVN